MKRSAFIVQYLIIPSSSHAQKWSDLQKSPKIIDIIYDTLQAFHIAPAKHRVLQLPPFWLTKRQFVISCRE